MLCSWPSPIASRVAYLSTTGCLSSTKPATTCRHLPTIIRQLSREIPLRGPLFKAQRWTSSNWIDFLARWINHWAWSRCVDYNLFHSWQMPLLYLSLAFTLTIHRCPRNLFNSWNFELWNFASLIQKELRNLLFRMARLWWIDHLVHRFDVGKR